MIDINDDESAADPKEKRILCRRCLYMGRERKKCMIRVTKFWHHIRISHRGAWRTWYESKSEFGFSVFNHFEVKDIRLRKVK